MNPTDNIFYLALIVIIILGITIFGLLRLVAMFIGKQMKYYSKQENDKLTNIANSPNVANPQTGDNEQVADLIKNIDALSKKIDDYHEQDLKKSQGDRFENLGLILFGLSLATLSLALSLIIPPLSSDRIAALIVSSITTIVFWILGAIAVGKVKKYRRWSDFWGS